MDKGLSTYLLLALLCLGALPAKAQTLRLSSSADSMRIGDHLELLLDFDLPVGWAPKSPTQPAWLETGDVLPASEDLALEVLSISETDSIRDGDRYTLQRRIRVTSFDTGYVALSPLQALFGNDTLESNALLLFVAAPEVSPNAVPRDIKDVRSVRYTWWDRALRYLPYALGAAMLLLTLYIGIRLARRKKQSEKEAPVLEKRPPHLVALEALDRLEAQELWQKGQTKAYHVALNDILRNYLSDRFGIRTLERTSGEILTDLRMEGLGDDLMRKLRAVFEVSDMVKFAKYPAGQAENSRSIEHARHLVIRTKKEDAE